MENGGEIGGGGAGALQTTIPDDADGPGAQSSRVLGSRRPNPTSSINFLAITGELSMPTIDILLGGSAPTGPANNALTAIAVASDETVGHADVGPGSLRAEASTLMMQTNSRFPLWH